MAGPGAFCRERAVALAPSGAATFGRAPWVGGGAAADWLPPGPAAAGCIAVRLTDFLGRRLTCCGGICAPSGPVAMVFRGRSVAAPEMPMAVGLPLRWVSGGREDAWRICDGAWVALDGGRAAAMGDN